MTAPVPPAVPRQLASNVFRLSTTAALGAGSVLMAAGWAEKKFNKAPDENGNSVGYTDRNEARDLVLGHKSMTQYLGISALIPVSILYSHARKNNNAFEHAFALHAYHALGGALVMTMFGAGLVSKLSPSSD